MPMQRIQTKKMKEKNKVNVKVSVSLRDNLIKKKYKIKTDGLDSVIQKMYDMMNKLKLWDELKEVKKK